MNEQLKKKYKNVVIKALKEYDIEYDMINFLIEETNVFFEVTGNPHVVVKIFQEESSKIEDNLIEAITLEEISSRTNIVVPSIMKSKEGKQVIFVESDDFDIVKRVAVYKYIEGDDFDGKETLPLFESLGEITATIHKALKDVILPNNLIPKKWDKVFYYRDEVPIYHVSQYDDYFTKEDRDFLDKFIIYLDRVLPKYYKGEEHLIHADLNPWNVKLHNNEIRLLDFEEGMIGSVIHEVAIMLFYYKYDPKYDEYKVKEAFFKGYSKILELPIITEYDIDVLIAARATNFVNYNLLIDDNPKIYIDRQLERLRGFVSKYEIEL